MNSYSDTKHVEERKQISADAEKFNVDVGIKGEIVRCLRELWNMR